MRKNPPGAISVHTEPPLGLPSAAQAPRGLAACFRLSGKCSNRRLAAGLAGVAVAMVGVAYAAVPLYSLFCQVTGFGGTPGIADAARGRPAAIDRTVTIRFNADVAGALPWRFKPVQSAMTLHLGESALAYYRATNSSLVPVTGTATFNVTPAKAAPYFTKVECFCFTEQTLRPGEVAEMPVSFYVDPAMVEDPDTRDVRTLTLSYTFFRATEEPS